MSNYTQLIYLAIEQENVDMLISLVQRADYIPGPLTRVVMNFINKFDKKHNIGADCTDFDCFVEAYLPWSIEHAYKQGFPAFLKFVVDIDPHHLKSLVSFLTNRTFMLSEEEEGAVAYWVVYNSKGLPDTDFLNEYLDKSVKRVIGYDKEDELISGFIAEAERQDDYEPLRELHLVYYRAGADYEFANVLGEIKYSKVRSAYIGHFIAMFKDKPIEFTHSLFWLVGPNEAIRIIAEASYSWDEKTKRELALELTSLHHNKRQPKYSDRTLLGFTQQPIDDVFWQYFIYFYIRDRADLSNLSKFLEYKPLDPNFDVYRLEKEEVLAKAGLY